MGKRGRGWEVEKGEGQFGLGLGRVREKVGFGGEYEDSRTSGQGMVLKCKTVSMITLRLD